MGENRHSESWSNFENFYASKIWSLESLQLGNFEEIPKKKTHRELIKF